MQYLVKALDGTDDQAFERRMAVREAHIALGNKLRDEGKMLYGVALLNETGTMTGSVLIVDFETRQDLDDWLAIEPYMTGKVWQTVDITPCQVGPSFL